jgi:flagellar biosynthetic protein FliQ
VAYIPKMLAVVCVFILCLPWISRMLVSYTAELLINLPQYAR